MAEDSPPTVPGGAEGFSMYVLRYLFDKETDDVILTISDSVDFRANRSVLSVIPPLFQGHVLIFSRPEERNR